MDENNACSGYEQILAGVIFMEQNNKSMRNAMIRISATNIVKKSNKALGVNVGDTIQYSMDDVIRTLEDWIQTKYFYYYVIEHNSDPDNIHYHIVIEFRTNSQGKFNQIKNRFPYGRIENCKHGVKPCVQYLVHLNEPDKVKYSWDSVITNAPDRLALYKVPGKTTMAMKCQVILNKIVAGEIKEYQINEIPPDVYLKYGSKIRSAFDYRQQTILMNPNRNLLVVALQGPPRVGKSLFCKMWSDLHNKSYYISSNSNDFCQDLKGQDTLILDDYNWHNMPLEDLLKLLDPHSMSTIKSRFKNKLFIGDTIMITTNTPINEWYRNEDLVLRDALYKRISAILDFGPLQEDGTVQYTVNRIIYNDSMRNSNENPMQLQQIEAVKTFDLKKYINIQSDQKKIDEFVQGLDDM